MANMYDDFTMKVNGNQVGRIIGRGGSKIKELQEDSGAKITVSREEDQDGKKTVEISGHPDQIDKARDLIDGCLRNDFGRRGNSGGYGYQSRNSGGSSWGRRDEGDRWGDRDRWNDRDRGNDRDRSGRRNFEEGGSKETIYVDSSEVGRIIGRSGSRIHDMENSSGCKIKVARESHSGGCIPVDIFGRTDQIARAKKLIHETGVELINGDDRGRGW